MTDELTPEDVITTRLLLLHLVPAELANQILDEAEYWPIISSAFRAAHDFTLAATGENRFDATKCCLLTSRIPNVEGVPVKVREVRFEINSHDQGWGGESLPGPYEGSYTWFEAVIVRSFQDEDGNNENYDADLQEMLEHREHYTAARTGPIFWRTKGIPPKSFLFGLIGSTPGRILKLGTVMDPNSHSDAWPVRRNQRAQVAEQVYSTVWSQHVDPNLDEEAYFQYTGGSLGAGFVEQLQPGDRIALLARARFPSWVNYIRRASTSIILSV